MRAGVVRRERKHTEYEIDHGLGVVERQRVVRGHDARPIAADACIQRREVGARRIVRVGALLANEKYLEARAQLVEYLERIKTRA